MTEPPAEAALLLLAIETGELVVVIALYSMKTDCKGQKA
jgi:hypothetical protein